MPVTCRLVATNATASATSSAARDLLDSGGCAGLTTEGIAALAGCGEQTPWREFTLHYLLSHTSGLGHWTDLVPDFDPRQPGTADEFLARAVAWPLRTAPDGTWHYSSPGYLLAARVMARATGLRYADVLTEQVLSPLGMTDTVVGVEPPDRVAHGHRRGQRADRAAFAAMPGAGDVWSTAVKSSPSSAAVISTRRARTHCQQR